MRFIFLSYDALYFAMHLLDDALYFAMHFILIHLKLYWFKALF